MTELKSPGIDKVAATKPRRSGVGTGTTSLLMIFTVLCFATLAMLSLSTANSNRRIQERGFDRISSLAEAAGSSDLKLSELDAAIAAISSENEQDYFEKALAAGEKLGCQADRENNTLVFSVPVDENSDYVTLIHILPPGEPRRYFIQTQATMMTDEWTPEPRGQVWMPPSK